jgi:hypothetical protein
MAERRYLTAAQLARQAGFTARWLTARAAAGEIPGACQPGGAGGAWRFDEELFWRWWDEQAARGKQWRPSTNAARSGGDVSTVKAVSSDSPLRRRLKALRESV